MERKISRQTERQKNKQADEKMLSDENQVVRGKKWSNRSDFESQK